MLKKSGRLSSDTDFEQPRHISTENLYVMIKQFTIETELKRWAFVTCQQLSIPLKWVQNTLLEHMKLIVRITKGNFVGNKKKTSNYHKWTKKHNFYFDDMLTRGCQHPSNKFEIFWKVAHNSLSLPLSYFVAKYVLITVVCSFFVKIHFSFREMTFFVRPLNR